MADDHFKLVRGSVIRVTRTDGCGVPLPGASSVVVTDNVSSVGFEEVTEEGTSIRERNFGDKIKTIDDAQTSVLGYTANIALMGTSPSLLNLFTDQPVVKNEAGDVIGFDNVTGIDLDDFGFAIEIWSKLAGNRCTQTGLRQYGYTVFPFLKGGRLTVSNFENAAINIGVQGARTQDGNGWGAGPFDVMRSTSGDPAPLFTPLGVNTHYRQITTTLAPPAVTDGAVPLGSV